MKEYAQPFYKIEKDSNVETENYEGMSAQEFNDKFLERLGKVEIEPRSDMAKYKDKLRAFGWARVVARDEHAASDRADEPMCQSCLCIGNDKGIEHDLCPSCKKEFDDFERKIFGVER